MNAMTLQVINREYNGISCFEFGLEMILEGLDRLQGWLVKFHGCKLKRGTPQGAHR